MVVITNVDNETKIIEFVCRHSMSMVENTAITMTGGIPTDPDKEIILMVTEIGIIMRGEIGMTDMLELVNKEMGDETSNSQILGAAGKEVKATSQRTRKAEMRKGETGIIKDLIVMLMDNREMKDQTEIVTKKEMRISGGARKGKDKRNQRRLRRDVEWRKDVLKRLKGVKKKFAERRRNSDDWRKAVREKNIDVGRMRDGERRKGEGVKSGGNERRGNETEIGEFERKEEHLGGGILHLILKYTEILRNLIVQGVPDHQIEVEQKLAHPLHHPEDALLRRRDASLLLID